MSLLLDKCIISFKFEFNKFRMRLKPSQKAISTIIQWSMHISEVNFLNLIQDPVIYYKT